MVKLARSVAELRAIVESQKKARSKKKVDPRRFAREQEWIRRIVKGIVEYYKVYGKRPSNSKLADMLDTTPETVGKYRKRAEEMLSGMPCPFCGAEQKITI